jgi:nitrite reductase/ring-hydroxylating ferredoxin subunit
LTQPLDLGPTGSGLVELFEIAGGFGDLLTFASDYPHRDADDPAYILRRLPAGWQSKVANETPAPSTGWVPGCPPRSPLETDGALRRRPDRGLRRGSGAHGYGRGPACRVVRRGDRIAAIRDYCPHQAGPLCAGPVRAELGSDGVGSVHRQGDLLVVACPWHGWEFEIFSGRSTWEDPSYRAKTYPATIENGRVMVEVGVSCDKHG